MPRNEKPSYSDEQKQEFVELAQEIGIRGAQKQLGYPGSYTTAHRWAESMGVTIHTDMVKRQAAILGVIYEDADRLSVAQAIYEEILKVVREGNLSAEELNKIANAAQRVVQTMQLIEGKATDRKEMWQRDGQDVELAEMINEAKAKAQKDIAEAQAISERD